MKPVKAIARPLVSAGSKFALNTGLLKNIKTPDGYEFSVSKNMHWGDLLGLHQGRYEQHEIGLLREHFRESDCIIDLGSNIGVVSRIALEEKLAPNGQMICVEPNPNSFAALQTNMARGLEHKSDRVVTFEHAAIGRSENGDSTAEFLVRNNLASGLSSHLNRDQPDTPIQVDVKSLSDILKQVSGRFSLIADIEGAEIDLIQKEPQALANCDQIMIELHDPALTGREETPDILLEQLEDLGFTLQGHSGNAYCLTR